MQTILVEVEEHDALPDGCLMRFSALGPARPVHHVRCDLPDGSNAVCLVEGRDEKDQPVEAWVASVDDSSAGQSWLVGGGLHGVRLSAASGETWAEAYLLLDESCLVD
jgi:hypothetical protein